MELNLGAEAEKPAKLTVKQERALEALLVGASDQQAADAAGVGRSTITGWRRLPHFADALAQARADLLKRVMARIHAATTQAVKTLEEVAKDTRNPSARVAAARALIEFSHRALELEELERRITELETTFAERRQEP